jgi:ketosteroid isomerase-like protein
VKSKATILICVLLFWANDYAMTKSTVKPASSQQQAKPGVYVDNPINGLSDEERIRKIEEDWPKALARKDAAWLGQHTADQLVFIDADGSALTKAAYLSRREDNPERTISGENNTDGVYIQGNLAFVHGNSHFHVEREGKEYFLSFRWTSTYVKQDGRWRVIGSQLTPINTNWRAAFVKSK